MKSFFDYFQFYFVESFKVIKLDKKAILRLANDANALPYALLILVLPPVFNFFLAALAFRKFEFTAFLVLLVFVLLNLLMILIMTYLAQTIFRGKLAFSYRAFFQTAAFANVLSWILLVPFTLLLLGLPLEGLFQFMIFIVGVWTFVIFYNLLKILHELKPLKAFFVVLIAVLMVAAMQNFFMDIFLGEEYKNILLNGLV